MQAWPCNSISGLRKELQIIFQSSVCTSHLQGYWMREWWVNGVYSQLSRGLEQDSSICAFFWCWCCWTRDHTYCEVTAIGKKEKGSFLFFDTERDKFGPTTDGAGGRLTGSCDVDQENCFAVFFPYLLGIFFSSRKPPLQGLKPPPSKNFFQINFTWKNPHFHFRTIY